MKQTNEMKQEKTDENEQVNEMEHLPVEVRVLRHADLPALDEAWLHRAELPERVEFFRGFLQPESLGMFEWFNMGFMLQNAGHNRLRCVGVYDDEYPIKCLATIARSIALAGGVLELEPYAILCPPPKPEETEAAQGNTVASEPQACSMEVA